MVKFKILGDYFFNNFHLAKNEGKDSADFEFEKTCPADTSITLWQTINTYSTIDKALDSVSIGHQAWSLLPLQERIAYLQRYQEILQKRSNDIATALGYETGCPLWDSQEQVASIIKHLNLIIETKFKFDKQILQLNITPNIQGKVYYRPLGPVLIVSPFNSPCEIPHFQILTALIAGNSIIFKPSEKCIYTAQLLIECFHQAHFPSGVINFINGSPEIVQRLIKEPIIKGIFFTGSKEAGKKILQTTHKDLQKLVVLSLSGKNFIVIDKDCSFDYTIYECIKAVFTNSGQKCTSAAIIFVHHKFKDQFIDRFHTLAKKIVIDNPFNHTKTPFMGPLIDEKALQDYLVYMGMAIREGAEEVIRGKQIERPYKGFYVSPSMHYLDQAGELGHYFKSEILGPNCLIIPFQEIGEIINFTKQLPFGLVGSYFGQDQFHFNEIKANTHLGLMNYNLGTNVASFQLPYCGHKNSGNYRSIGQNLMEQCHVSTSTLECVGPFVAPVIEEMVGF